MVTLGAFAADTYPTDEGAGTAYLIVFGVPLALALVVVLARIYYRRWRSGRSSGG